MLFFILLLLNQVTTNVLAEARMTSRSQFDFALEGEKCTSREGDSNYDQRFDDIFDAFHERCDQPVVDHYRFSTFKRHALLVGIWHLVCGIWNVAFYICIGGIGTSIALRCPCYQHAVTNGLCPDLLNCTFSAIRVQVGSRRAVPEHWKTPVCSGAIGC